MADKDYDYGLPTPGVFGVDPELHNQLVWYGVVTLDGRLVVKRYHDWLDYKEAGDSTCTRWVSRLFEAIDQEAAVLRASSIAAKFYRFIQ